MPRRKIKEKPEAKVKKVKNLRKRPDIARRQANEAKVKSLRKTSSGKPGATTVQRRAAFSYTAASEIAASTKVPKGPRPDANATRFDGITLRVGSDCSGMCAEILALETLLKPTHKLHHAFASDKNPGVRNFIKHAYNDVGMVYCDIHQRDVTKMCHVHLYHAGFPCTPWSGGGKQQGAIDPNGNLFFPIYVYVARWLPSTFVLENVASLPEQFPDTFMLMLEMLQTIKERNKVAYAIDFRIFDSFDHGMPVARKRVYIVGTRLTHQCAEMVWPPCSRTRRRLSEILDLPRYNEPEPQDMTRTNLKNLVIILQGVCEKDFREKEFICDLVSSKPQQSLDKCMTLTKTRCQSGAGIYSSKRNKSLTPIDFLRLNGIPGKRFKHWHSFASRALMGGMCGNGEALNVLTPIIKAALATIGLNDTKDPDWAKLDLK